MFFYENRVFTSNTSSSEFIEKEISITNASGEDRVKLYFPFS